MNHKRRRPKSRRAGCLLCKSHKANGAPCSHMSELRARQSEREQRADYAEVG